jgi:hypothetical protein
MGVLRRVCLAIICMVIGRGARMEWGGGELGFVGYGYGQRESTAMINKRSLLNGGCRQTPSNWAREPVVEP